VQVRIYYLGHASFVLRFDNDGVVKVICLDRAPLTKAA
jgi:hypothetical protein